MSTSLTDIVFPAVLETQQFASQEVRIEPQFPLVRIRLVDSSSGLHDFGVSKRLPHHHDSMLKSAIAEAQSQIDHFWSVLAFVRDTVIRPTGQVFYEFDGQRHEAFPKPQFGVAKGVAVANASWFDANRSALVAPYDLERVKRLNFACGIAEPIGRFVALYSLLLSEGSDRQTEVDRLILDFDGSTQQTLSPQSGKLETLYTRLRNELAHVRTTATVFSTYAEIELHLPRFEWLVKSVLRPRALLTCPPEAVPGEG